MERKAICISASGAAAVCAITLPPWKMINWDHWGRDPCRRQVCALIDLPDIITAGPDVTLLRRHISRGSRRAHSRDPRNGNMTRRNNEENTIMVVVPRPSGWGQCARRVSFDEHGQAGVCSNATARA